jgi:hypothetical protein
VVLTGGRLTSGDSAGDDVGFDGCGLRVVWPSREGVLAASGRTKLSPRTRGGTPATPIPGCVPGCGAGGGCGGFDGCGPAVGVLPGTGLGDGAGLGEGLGDGSGEGDGSGLSLGEGDSVGGGLSVGEGGSCANAGLGTARMAIRMMKNLTRSPDLRPTTRPYYFGYFGPRPISADNGIRRWTGSADTVPASTTPLTLCY